MKNDGLADADLPTFSLDIYGAPSSQAFRMTANYKRTRLPVPKYRMDSLLTADEPIAQISFRPEGSLLFGRRRMLNERLEDRDDIARVSPTRIVTDAGKFLLESALHLGGAVAWAVR